jgi:hypothetical protein
MKLLSSIRATGAGARARYASGVAYRNNDHVLEAARTEERELAALGREARMRRVRTGAVLGALFVLALGAPALADRLPGPRDLLSHCHRVTVKYEQAFGTPPPPVSWQVCEWR